MATGEWSLPDVMPQGLRYEEADGVATLTLARPERLNALTFDVYAGLRDAFAQLAERTEVRAVILTGEGRGFCSGGDVEDIIGRLLDRDEAALLDFTRMTCDVVANMRSCPQPIVAALNGTVAGAGAALAVASDVRIAVPDAKVAFLFVKAGLSGADMGVCHLLPRIVGLGRAAELLLVGDAITADEAHRIGLYNRVVSPTELLNEARATAARIAAGPAAGVPVTKHTLDAQLVMPFAQALEHDATVQARLMKHPDFREAYEAFKAKRPARFG
jgi:enoyl-CoA hydratase/carnithine racemase